MKTTKHQINKLVLSLSTGSGYHLQIFQCQMVKYLTVYEGKNPTNQKDMVLSSVFFMNPDIVIPDGPELFRVQTWCKAEDTDQALAILKASLIDLASRKKLEIENTLRFCTENSTINLIQTFK